MTELAIKRRISRLEDEIRRLRGLVECRPSAEQRKRAILKKTAGILAGKRLPDPVKWQRAQRKSWDKRYAREVAIKTK